MQDIKGSSHVHKNIDHPIGTFLYTVSCLHCMTVSLAQGGEGLGAMWGEEKTREYLQRAGFRSVEKHELAHDIQNNWYVVQEVRRRRGGVLFQANVRFLAAWLVLLTAVPAAGQTGSPTADTTTRRQAG